MIAWLPKSMIGKAVPVSRVCIFSHQKSQTKVEEILQQEPLEMIVEVGS